MIVTRGSSRLLGAALAIPVVVSCHTSSAQNPALGPLDLRVGHCAAGPPSKSFTPATKPAIASDFNGDGRADVATVNEADVEGSADHTAEVYFSGSRGVAECTQTVRLIRPEPLTQIASGDVNGDGFADLVEISPGRAAHVFLSSRHGFVQPKIETLPNPSASLNDINFGWSIAVTDFNQDGDDDLAIAGPSQTAWARYDPEGHPCARSEARRRHCSIGTSPAQAIYVYYGSGDGVNAHDRTRIPEPNHHTEFFGYSLFAADVTGDGFPDLVESQFGGHPPSYVLHRSWGESRVLFIPGSARGFGQPVRISNHAGHLAALNVIGESPADLLLTARHRWYALPGGHGTPGPERELGSFLPSSRTATADWNGDGSPDLIAADPNATVDGQRYAGAISIVRAKAAGLDFDHLTTLHATSGGIPGCTSNGYLGADFDVRDLNGDARPDIVASNWTSGSTCHRPAFLAFLSEPGGSFRGAVYLRYAHGNSTPSLDINVGDTDR